ncbi:tetratricopeptide repeat protein [Kitasatospora sp. McL0602]|uniref:tetratricopeptide repeat protein n=1 Tax=Kitasatospora sp. McL0602 TaxID=3439530 RepID=UPI003F88B5E7
MARKTATMDVPAGAEALAEVALPAGPAVWVGRRGEFAALVAAAARPDRGRCRVLVLAGRPGSGRTSLAVRFARSVAAEYPDGVLFARLSAPDGGRVPPGQAARRLLEQLGAEPAEVLLPGGEPGEQDPACAALLAALEGRRVLLLLDDVRDAGQLKPLLAQGPGCLVLATTAGPLTGIKDIDPVILGGLGLTASAELLGGLIGGTRISCDPVGAAELAESCASGPAALRLMAGWLRGNAKAAVTDAVREIAEATGHPKAAEPAAGPDPDAAPESARESARAKARRSKNGAKRGKGARNAPPAPETSAHEAVPVPDSDPLAGAFLLSYRALPAAQARMLRMLTLAPAQLADLRTASALVGCPAPEAGALLAKLAERELLDEELPAADGTLRYRLPGRLHARLVGLRESTDRPAEVELARARLLERFVRLVDSARALLDPAHGPVTDPLPGPLRLRTAGQARQWLLGERDLLLGAVADAIGRADLDGSAGRLVTALLRALPLTGAAAPADLHRLHELVLQVAERSGDPRRVTAALLNLGDLQAAAGRWERAAERYRAALGQARESGDEAACARALESVAGCCRALGDAVRAADWYGRALALRQSLGDRPAEARLLVRMAEAHLAQRRFDEAEREYRAALAALRRLADGVGQTAVSTALRRLREQVEGERDRMTSE